MKRIIIGLISIVGLLTLCSCGKSEISVSESLISAEYVTVPDETEQIGIKYNDNIYKMYCVVSKSELTEQIGNIETDEASRIYSYKNYSDEQWIVHLYVSGEMDNAVLYKEINVTDIPDGLSPDFE